LDARFEVAPSLLYILIMILFLNSPHANDDQKPPRLPQNPTSPADPQTGVLVKTRTKTSKPSMYKVLLLNDDFTPMEFVVHVLEKFFSKTRTEATEIMLHVHRRGVGLCGVYTYEVAETKVNQVMDFARANEQPLQCTMERD
jgi:ATP-dependent Clp protease adaptor protein ClpS